MKEETIDRLEKLAFRTSLTKALPKESGYRFIKVDIRFNDECKNGHNSFRITGELWGRSRRGPECCGCIHDEIAKYFPQLKKYLKWHNMNSDGPLYYIANTTYFASYKEPELEAARRSAIWPDGTLEQLQDKDILKRRLPELLLQFERDIIEIREKYLK